MSVVFWIIGVAIALFLAKLAYCLFIDVMMLILRGICWALRIEMKD